MLALPRRVLRMELPIVEHLVKKQDYTNTWSAELRLSALKKMKQQSLHHQQHPIFVKNLLSTDH